jgi:GR25 family glycosyltransferase involved in LPS biosynthesis
MSNKILDFFDGAFYINLEKRPDRREAFEERSKKCGINVERFPAISIDGESTKHCGTYSHIEVVKEAKKRNYNNCIIFEDDCVFVDNFLEKLNMCVDYLKNNEWDMFYMGGELAGNSTTINQYVANCAGMYGAHAYVVNKSFYDRIAKLDFRFGVIDTIYINMSNRKYLMANEILAFQDPSFYSDLWGGFIYRDDAYKQSYKKYLKYENG